MYAVIFKAQIRQRDEQYFQLASELREKARREYGCLEFTSLTEGDLELAISYWDSTEQIPRWKQDALHLEAQRLGRCQWYTQITVQIVKVEREYSHAEE